MYVLLVGWIEGLLQYLQVSDRRDWLTGHVNKLKIQRKISTFTAYFPQLVLKLLKLVKLNALVLSNPSHKITQFIDIHTDIFITPRNPWHWLFCRSYYTRCYIHVAYYVHVCYAKLLVGRPWMWWMSHVDIHVLVEGPFVNEQFLNFSSFRICLNYLL